jgi:hypothetical protein
MKRLLFLTILCAIAGAGCKTTNPVGDESAATTLMRPTIIISTTKGDMKVVLFPVFVLIDGKLYEEPREKQYIEFLKGVEEGYYNNAAFTSQKDIFGEYAIFSNAAGKDYTLEALPRDIQPVRGTLCIMRLDSGNRPGIFADKRRFMIVRKIRRNIGGQELAPLRGTHFPIGQVIEGYEVLDKLGLSDSIVSITMLKQGTPVNAKKLELLGNDALAEQRKVKPIDNFADVLSDKEIEPAETGAGDKAAPSDETAPKP